MTATFDPGSFRDPAGRILTCEGRIFRAVSQSKADEAKSVLDTRFFKRRIGTSIVSTWLPSDEVARSVLEGLSPHYALLLEHEKLGVVSYPFEWPFSLLKKAAELHLELHLEALDEGWDLSDSSAYNVQFAGSRPVFIDTLSFKRYSEGSYWGGYKQFCEQFLSPLLLTAYCDIPYNEWYRGALNGIDVRALATVLPMSARFSLQAQMHIFMHARLLNRVQSHKRQADAEPRKLPLASFKGILRGMLQFVRSLKRKDHNSSYWKEYEFKNSYSADDSERKRAAVSRFVSDSGAKFVLDVGCNSGDFSEVCLASGARSAVGFDFDQGALEAAVSRADEKSLPLLPLYQDLTNASSPQGWAHEERKSIEERVKPDAVVALAVLHHLIVGKNIPMESAIKWVVGLAPTGLIEFVPKQDPMLQGMLAHREDIFPNYTEDCFRTILSSQATVITEAQSSTSGRRLFVYKR
jgi:ribosomal protein L11 methylase PrmA